MGGTNDQPLMPLQSVETDVEYIIAEGLGLLIEDEICIVFFFFFVSGLLCTQLTENILFPGTVSIMCEPCEASSGEWKHAAS